MRDCYHREDRNVLLALALSYDLYNQVESETVMAEGHPLEGVLEYMNPGPPKLSALQYGTISHYSCYKLLKKQKFELSILPIKQMRRLCRCW